MAVVDAGATGVLGILCCVNDGREDRTCSLQNRRNIGKEQHFLSVCLLPCYANTGLDAKRGGDFASRCVALAWDVLFFRVRPAGQEF